MHRYSRWARIFAAVTIVGLATWVLAKDPTPTDLGKENVEKFKKIRPGELLPLIKGTRQVQDGDKKNIELAAQVLVWRVSWPLTPNNNPKVMDEVRKQFNEEISALLAKQNKGNNKAYRKMFAKYLIGCFKKVFELPFDENRIGCVNAAILLPSLARLNDDEDVGDFLAELIKDPKKHDSIKLYALKGLAAFFPAYEWTVIFPKDNAGNVVSDAQKKRYIERIKVVTDFLQRKWEPKTADDDAVSFLRRQAIKTLGQAQVPAVEVKNQKVDGSVVGSLLKILDPMNGMTPPPSLQEKIEAAIGICQIKLIPNSLYLPELGIYRVGTLLVEFADAYQKDKRVVGTIRSIPWKVQGERLTQALKLQVKNLDNSEPARKKAQVLLDTVDPDLKAIKAHLDNLPDDPKALGKVVNGMKPPTRAVFTGIKPEIDKPKNDKPKNDK